MSPSVVEASSADKRGKNFDVNEDKLLVLAWLNTSLDPTTNVKGDRFWERVEKYYVQEKKEDWQTRSRSSLNHRWGVIQHAVGKFCGFISQVEDADRSGISDGDKIQEARRLYYDTIKSPFRFDHCWDLLKDEEKWKKREKLSVKRKCTGSCNLQPEVVSLDEDDEPSGANGNEQPNGRKDGKEKKRLRKNLLGDVSRFTSALSELKGEKQKDRAEKMEKLNLANKQKYEFLEIKKSQLLQAQEANRIQKEKLQLMYHIENEKLKLEREREDTSIMMKDLSSMDPEQREYFQMRRMEILGRKNGNA